MIVGERDFNQSLIDIERNWEKLGEAAFVISNRINERLMSVVNEIAQSCVITATCLYGSRVGGYAREDSDYDCLLILENYRDAVRYHYRKLDSINAAVLAVDKELFELDVEKGGLGDFVAGRLMSPYLPLKNPEYLESAELQVKRRVVEEETEDLVLEYGELARGLEISPEYFPLVRMKKRAKVYPPIRYSYVKLFRGDLKEKNMRMILEGYDKAIDTLTKSKIIGRRNGHVILADEHIDRILSRKTYERVVNVVEQSRRALYSYLTHGTAGIVSIDIVAKELASKIRRELLYAPSGCELEDPKNFLFLRTSSGLTSLNERASIYDVARKLRPDVRVAVTPLASVLNEVYLISAGEEKLVAKRFTDWHGFKWFTLNLVALGTKIFSLAGKTRLANEYGMNRFLSENKIPVPNIIHVSIPDRMLFEQYIEGTHIVEIVKESVMLSNLSQRQKHVIRSVGASMAKVHSLGVGIGDTKPENFILGSDQKVYALDLEQAKKAGDKVWDISEFLYYAGHYGVGPSGGLHEFVKSFIEGYILVGDAESLRRASGINYLKVFSFWTPPLIIREISQTLSRA